MYSTRITSLLLTVFVSLTTLNFAFSQSYRGLGVNEKYKADYIQNFTSKTYALLLGSDNYDNYSDLKNPIYDVDEIGRILRNNYSFETEILKNPSADQVLTAIKNYKKILNSSDRFLIYIAGHGIYDDVFYKEGFLVLKDSKDIDDDPNLLSLLPFQHIKSLTNSLPSNQVMLVVDVCFGGAFNESISSSRSINLGYYQMSASDFLRDQMNEYNRFVLSSGRMTPVLDGLSGQHSPFAQRFINSLRTHYRDSIVTAQSIYNDLKTLSSRPVLGYYNESKVLTDFVFKAESLNKDQGQIALNKAIQDYERYMFNISYDFSKKKKLTSSELKEIGQQLLKLANNGNAEASYWVSMLANKKHGLFLPNSDIQRYAQFAYEAFQKEYSAMNDKNALKLAVLQTEGLVKVTSESSLKNLLITSMGKEEPLSFYHTGNYCLRKGDLKFAYRYYLQGAENGDPFCQYELSSLIFEKKEELTGLGIKDMNYKKWLIMAKENGLKRASDVVIRYGIDHSYEK